MAQMPRLRPRDLARFFSDRKGGVAVLTAVAMTGLLGAAGLGTEATLWYVAKRDMQAAADAAAFSAATAEAAGANSTAFTAAADAIASQYGFTNGANGVVVAVNNPPSSGGYTTNGQAVEVVISQTQTMLFSRVFMSTAPTIGSRAVGLPGSVSGGCVMALDRGSVTDVSDSGTSTLNLNDCSMIVNSSSSHALTLSGNVTINAESADIVGNWTKSGVAALNTTDGINVGVSPAADPYASVPIPSYSHTTCNANAARAVSSVTVGPSVAGGTYVFCNGLNISGGSTKVTLQPGTYIINGGSLNISGGATLCAAASCGGSDGVTIVLTSSSGTNYGSVQESGGSAIDIVPPTSGATAGMAFYQDRSAPATASSSFSGNSTQSITGAMYFPSAGVSYSGTSATATSNCTQLIGYTLTFSGTVTFDANCTGVGIKGLGSGSTKLVE
ncbi:MAG TPA: pilus assembly protein TadG-related protein [Stellaceae bacterium]|nr:pilus assembly protein TadG-related protein [Stellaceae bacterium]